LGPIPNPQSPIPNPHAKILFKLMLIVYKLKLNYNYFYSIILNYYIK